MSILGYILMVLGAKVSAEWELLTKFLSTTDFLLPPTQASRLCLFPALLLTPPCRPFSLAPEEAVCGRRRRWAALSRKARVVGWRCGARAPASRGLGERLDGRERVGESRLVKSGGCADVALGGYCRRAVKSMEITTTVPLRACA